MQILLDTQTIVWYIKDDSLLTQNARQAIQHADLAYASAISFYEIAIKLAIGKDAGITQPLSEIIKRVLASGFYGFLYRPATLKPIHLLLSLVITKTGSTE